MDVQNLETVKSGFQTDINGNKKVTTHSPIGASSMYRWSACPASVRMSKGIQSVPSSYAAEGTEAHDWLAKILCGLVPVSSVPGPQTVGREDMRECVQFAHDAVAHQMTKTVKDGHVLGKLWVEQGFDLSHIYPGCHGTADIVIYDPLKKMLIVSDYKHGRGILVEVENNSQLMYYGLGALTTLADVGEIDTVRLQVIQPRAAHPSGSYVRSWDVDPVDLMDFAISLQDYAKETENENAKLVAGDHCRFCPAQPVCPELSEQAHKLAGEAFDIIADENKNGSGTAIQVQNNTVSNLGKILSWIPTLKAWAKSVEEYAYRQANHGVSVPGFKLVQKRSRRSWVDDAQVVAVLKKGGSTDEEIYEARKVKSPAQIEKSLTKEERLVMDQYILNKSTGLVLVQNTDKRPAVPVGASVEFDKITEGE